MCVVILFRSEKCNDDPNPVVCGVPLWATPDIAFLGALSLAKTVSWRAKAIGLTRFDRYS